MSESISEEVTATAPTLVGVWVHDPVDPEASARNYLHATGTAEEVDIEPAEVTLMGRTNPVLEYGEAELVGLKLSITVPFSSDHDAQVEAWRSMLRNRRAICYRDNRGRLIYAGIVGRVGVKDAREGTVLSIALRRIDYDEAV